LASHIDLKDDQVLVQVSIMGQFPVFIPLHLLGPVVLPVVVPLPEALLPPSPETTFNAKTMHANAIFQSDCDVRPRELRVPPSQSRILLCQTRRQPPARRLVQPRPPCLLTPTVVCGSSPKHNLISQANHAPPRPHVAAPPACGDLPPCGGRCVPRRRCCAAEHCMCPPAGDDAPRPFFGFAQSRSTVNDNTSSPAPTASSHPPPIAAIAHVERVVWTSASSAVSAVLWSVVVVVVVVVAFCVLDMHG
jgi:hypothetical protein